MKYIVVTQRGHLQRGENRPFCDGCGFEFDLEETCSSITISNAQRQSSKILLCEPCRCEIGYLLLPGQIPV